MTFRPAEPADRSRAVLHHIMDRLEIRPELRRAWCVAHAEELMMHEFRGLWGSRDGGVWGREAGFPVPPPVIPYTSDSPHGPT